MTVPDLPPELCKLTALTVLGLGDNQLTELPPELKTLMDRGVVKLSGNPLKG
jgi:Leucine-rich repeat (LRR) protein